jgi:uncharacterized protein YbjQ (UPF0145 family)
MELIIVLVGSFGGILVGLIVGKLTDSRHLRRLAAREGELCDVIRCNLKRLPRGLKTEESFLVTGSAVIATDYFKTVAAGLRNIFGGEIKSYQTLMNRARREAIVRMLEEAKGRGAGLVWNVRFETATIQGKRRPGGVEVLAYGTAVKRA